MTRIFFLSWLKDKQWLPGTKLLISCLICALLIFKTNQIESTTQPANSVPLIGANSTVDVKSANGGPIISGNAWPVHPYKAPYLAPVPTPKSATQLNLSVISLNANNGNRQMPGSQQLLKSSNDQNGATPANAATPANSLSGGNTAATVSQVDDPIITLDYSSINDEILRKRTANFVYFNANFKRCRHCSRFYAIWRELALDIRWWRQVIKLFTINCSDDDNIDVCRRAGVTQFPQVKFYWIQAQSLDEDGQRIRLLGKSVHAMRHMIVEKVMDSYMEHKQLVLRAQQQRLSGVGMQGPLQALMPLIGQIFSGQSLGGGAQGGDLFSMLLGGGGGGGGSESIGKRGPALGEILQALSGLSSWRKSLAMQPLPGNWPDLEPIEVESDAVRLLDSLPLDAKRGIGALLVMETQEFLATGLEVMLDLSPYSNSTYLARVRDERSLLSQKLTRRDDVRAPALIYVSETREVRLLLTAPKYTNDEDLRRAFVRTFERRLVKSPVRRVWRQLSSSSSDSLQQLGQEDEELVSRLHQLHMGDLLNALRASLMDQVFRHPDLSDDQYNALVKYVYVLINYFPFNEAEPGDQLASFLKRLHAWLQNQVSPIDLSEYKKQFHDSDEAFGGKRREWVSCKSFSSSKSIPSSERESGPKSPAGMLFENPAQFGKMVSNITRLLRTGQQKAGQLKNLLGMFVALGNSTSGPKQRTGSQYLAVTSAANVTGAPKTKETTGGQTDSEGTTTSSATSTSKPRSDESPIERLLSSLTSGSLGSDSSILKLISSALGAGSSHANTTKPSKFAREFPCGAWKLAHVLLVNEFLKDSPRKDVKHIVLHSLYQYMLNFYVCPTCGNRVSEVIGEFRLNLDEQLKEQSDSIMLLWKVHNRVNRRLESEFRPGSPPKQQWPSEALCPRCRLASSPNEPMQSSSTPNWQEKQVLNFLVHHYWPKAIVALNKLESSSSSSKLVIPLGPHFLIPYRKKF